MPFMERALTHKPRLVMLQSTAPVTYILTIERAILCPSDELQKLVGEPKGNLGS
jgi:hypothetical protein